ncbi:MAG TPA: threonine-phosphate decarboxylase CobD [Thermodesulfovibrionales bacterium]|nr:threonine-phosphate decarboxylase CobD [Thermodesulfovibrionales bacterium]
MKQSEHGGNIYRLADELKIQEREVIDFSASVNPLGVSKKVKAEIRRHLKYLHRYPDPDAKRLRKRLGQHHAIDPGAILCGNGSTGLICLITKAFSPQRVIIPAPTYSEYERAVHSAMRQDERAQIEHLVLKAEDGYAIIGEEYIHALQKGWFSNSSRSNHQSSLPFEMAFLCNPNNPTGRLLKRQEVKNIADAAREHRCYLVVDEAFIDFSPDDSVIQEVAENPYLIVLRSMTHFYALAGLRLGYGVFPVNLIERLQQCRAPWTVNSLAQKAAAVSLKDKAYRKESMAVIRQEKAFLEKSFRKLGITFFPSDANFYLVKTAVAHEACRRLRSKGILVRDCSDFQGLDSSYMRIAVKSHRENTVLIKELTRIVAPGE